MEGAGNARFNDRSTLQKGCTSTYQEYREVQRRHRSMRMVQVTRYIMEANSEKAI